MALYKVARNFHGVKENKNFKAGDTAEFTVKRADEINKNIKTNPKFGYEVLERQEEADK